jgi:hypothetical protein
VNVWRDKEQEWLFYHDLLSHIEVYEREREPCSLHCLDVGQTQIACGDLRSMYVWAGV